MKKILRSLCSPILNIFESDEEQYNYRASHRKILIVVGLMFLVLSSASLYVALQAAQWGGVVPVIGFMVAGLVCEIVGLLGTDQAVAKIWKSK